MVSIMSFSRGELTIQSRTKTILETMIKIEEWMTQMLLNIINLPRGQLQQAIVSSMKYLVQL